jgi:hypothetical protein
MNIIGKAVVFCMAFTYCAFITSVCFKEVKLKHEFDGQYPYKPMTIKHEISNIPTIHTFGR